MRCVGAIWNELVVDRGSKAVLPLEFRDMHKLLGVLPNLAGVRPQGEPEANQVGLVMALDLPQPDAEQSLQRSRSPCTRT
jgi:hypothetical protein